MVFPRRKCAKTGVRTVYVWLVEKAKNEVVLCVYLETKRVASGLERRCETEMRKQTRKEKLNDMRIQYRAAWLSKFGMPLRRKRTYEERRAVFDALDLIWPSADFGRPKALKQWRKEWGQYPRNPTSRANRCVWNRFLHSPWLRLRHSTSYFDVFLSWARRTLSSRGTISSRRTIVLLELEINTRSGLRDVAAASIGNRSWPSRL